MSVASIPSVVSAVASSPSTAADTSSGKSSSSSSSKSLGSDDFMSLLLVEMQNQDPLDPMDNTEYIAQLAQFTSLNQTQTMSKELGYLRSDMQLASANGMIGKRVTVSDDSGTATGNVTAVSADEKGVYLTIGGKNYAYTSVTKVEAETSANTAE